MTTDIDPSKSFKEEIVTAESRWHNGILQQKWKISTVVNYSLIGRTDEWRDVPVVSSAPNTPDVSGVAEGETT